MAVALPIARPCAWILALGLLTPAAAFAGPPPPPSPEASDQSLDEAREMHERAQTRYEMFDYLGAIEQWMEAYRILKADENSREIRNAIIWNIATARIKAYEVDKDVRHLHQGLLLLRKYLQEYVSIYGAADGDAETMKIRKKVDELNDLIESSQPDEPPPGAPFPASGNGGGSGGTSDGSSSGDGAPPSGGQNDGKPGKKDKKKVRTLTIVGGVMMGVGAGLSGIAFAGMAGAKKWQGRYEDFPADREQIATEGNKQNTLIVVGAASAGVVFAAGAALLIVDQLVLKKKGDKKGKAKAKKAFAPTFSPHGAGVAWSTQF